MARKTKRYVVLLLALVLAALNMPAAFASADKLTYDVTYSAEDLSTPTDWYNSSLFDNPAYKENRFVQYWVETPITPGGPRDTGFYMAYNEEGLTIFFQSNEAERGTDGVLLNSSIEMFLQTGDGDVPYHQMIIHTDGSPIEYYEWQTEYRNNRPLKGNVTVINEEIPTGWGTVVHIPWETYYEHVPLNGENWAFSMIRWSPSHSPTWGGRVHQVGRFNVLDFEAPNAAQRTDIQKHVIRAAWNTFTDTADELQDTWLNGDADDERFYNQAVRPLIDAGEALGADIPNLDGLNAAQIDALYAHIERWFELRYDVEDARIAYIKNRLFHENSPPTVTDVTYTLQVNTQASGFVFGTDPDGDALAYSLGDAPEHGTAVVETDGQWTYTPNENYIGSDRFTVVAADPSGAQAIATVNLLVSPGPETSVTLDPAEPGGSGGWYTSDVTVALTTTDAHSDVERTEYRLDGGAWIVYDGPFTIAEEGVHELEYRGVNTDGITEQIQSAVIRIDKSAPTVQVSLDPSVLWPPNNKLVPIQASLTYDDSVSGIASVVLASITNNEDNDANDIADAEFGTHDTSFSLRAERNGSGNGRVYTVTYTVTDHAGHTASASATVTVPKNQSGH